MRSNQVAKWLAVALTLSFSGASSLAGAEDASEAPSGAKGDEPEARREKPAESEDQASDDASEADPYEDETEGDSSEDGAPEEDGEEAEDTSGEDGEDASDEEAEDASDEKSEDDEEERPPVARDDEPLVLLESDRVLRIKQRGARLRQSAYDRLHDIAERYHEVTDRRLVVTGGGRTPARQAELMHDMMADGKNLLRLYIQVGMVRPLIKVYEEGKEKRWGRRRTVGVMTKIIDDQVKEGRYVSRHLAHTAADVRSRGLDDEEVQALEKAVSEVKGARLVDERNGNAPHFHLSL